MVNKEELISFETEIGNTFNEGKIKAPIHLYSGNEEITNSSVGLDGGEELSAEESAEAINKLTDEQKAKMADAQDDFKEEAEAIDVEGMDEDEKDLGEDSLATMMHDPENADGF